MKSIKKKYNFTGKRTKRLKYGKLHLGGMEAASTEETPTEAPPTGVSTRLGTGRIIARGLEGSKSHNTRRKSIWMNTMKEEIRQSTTKKHLAGIMLVLVSNFIQGNFILEDLDDLLEPHQMDDFYIALDRHGRNVKEQATKRKTNEVIHVQTRGKKRFQHRGRARTKKVSKIMSKF